MIQTLLWDNDGVLVDSEKVFFETTRAAFNSAGLDLTIEYWAKFYLGARLRSIDIAIKLGASRTTAQDIVDKRNIAFQKRLKSPIPVMPKIPEVITACHKKYRMAVVTSAPRRQFDLVHKHTKLLSFFECVVTADDCKREKPDPETYLLTMHRMNVQPDSCLAIEDSPRGLTAAVSAGIKCVIIPTPLTDISACKSACAIIENAGKLEQVISSL